MNEKIKNRPTETIHEMAIELYFLWVLNFDSKIIRFHINFFINLIKYFMYKF